MGPDGRVHAAAGELETKCNNMRSWNHCHWDMGVHCREQEDKSLVSTVLKKQTLTKVH